jgi:hypothetical protein
MGCVAGPLQPHLSLDTDSPIENLPASTDAVVAS